MKKPLNEDRDNMETILLRLAKRDNIWQDRFIYWIAKAIWDICGILLKMEDKK